MIPALIVSLITLLAPLAPGAAPVDDTWEDPAQRARSCAPPCGEINPRLLFEFEGLDREPMALEQGDKVTFDGTITYWFDADDEGYVPNDPQSPIVIQFSFPRLPTWAQMSVEPGEVPVDTTCPTCVNSSSDDPAQPTAHYEYVQPITMTLEVVGEPEQTPGYDYGKLQVFAKSSESGIYNPGYGIKEVRVQADEGEPLEKNGFANVPTAGVLTVVAVLGSLAAAARRRR